MILMVFIIAAFVTVTTINSLSTNVTKALSSLSLAMPPDSPEQLVFQSQLCYCEVNDCHFDADLWQVVRV